MKTHPPKQDEATMRAEIEKVRQQLIETPEKKLFREHPLSLIRRIGLAPILYTDDIDGIQTLRDDLWLTTTDYMDRVSSGWSKPGWETPCTTKTTSS